MSQLARLVVNAIALWVTVAVVPDLAWKDQSKFATHASARPAPGPWGGAAWRPSSRSSSGATRERPLDAAAPGLAAAARYAAGRWGTPAYLYDLRRLRDDAQAVGSAFPDPWLRLYALKANGLPPLISELPGLGYGAGAVSGGELTLAGRAGFPVAQTALDGIGQTPADLRRAVALAAAGTPLLL